MDDSRCPDCDGILINETAFLNGRLASFDRCYSCSSVFNEKPVCSYDVTGKLEEVDDAEED